MRLIDRIVRLAKRVPTNEIEYPFEWSEFEVQADLYWKLKQNGVEVRGNVRAVCEDFERKHKAYLDLVVFKDRKAFLIIECKNWTRPRPNARLSSRQARRYAKFGLPVLPCFNMASVPQVVLDVLGLLEKSRDESERGL